MPYLGRPLKTRPGPCIQGAGSTYEDEMRTAAGGTYEDGSRKGGKGETPGHIEADR